MSYIAQLTIPKIQSDDNLKLYIYRSLNADDINTISKVAQLHPVIIINQETAETVTVNDKECFQVTDQPENRPGVTYNGPQLNTVPIIEYETSIELIKLNTYTFVNELVLTPLELTHKNGIVFYYSVIAVNETANQMSHLSKVNGILVNYIQVNDLTRQVWATDDKNDDSSWELITTLNYNELTDKISIGDVNKPYQISQLGLPVVETVPQINYVGYSLNSLISNTFMTLKIQNPWQNNNYDFNFRKLKSYKIRNVYESLYGEFSTPTYQSELPVFIEKMIIMLKINPDDPDAMVRIDAEGAQKFEIIRKDGIYYNKLEHKSLGYNLWNIPLESNKLNVFSESSVQDEINIQISAVPANLYVFDIYLIDVYQNISENKHCIIET